MKIKLIITSLMLVLVVVASVDGFTPQIPPDIPITEIPSMQDECVDIITIDHKHLQAESTEQIIPFTEPLERKEVYKPPKKLTRYYTGNFLYDSSVENRQTDYKRPKSHDGIYIYQTSWFSQTPTYIS